MKKIINGKRITDFVTEFLLIVVGILVALQIENWNDERKSQSFKNKTLSQIKSALKRDVEHFNNRIRRLESISESVGLIAEHLEKELPESDIFASEFSRISWSLVLETRTAAYESLKSSGLDAIKSSELKVNLINVYDYIYPRLNWFLENKFNKFNDLYATPFLFRYFSLEKEAGDENPVWNTQLYQQLLNDKKALTLLYRKQRQIHELKLEIQLALTEIEKLLSSIDNETQL
ncbi:DUF6090 family protein [Aliikangiella coralliicola]|uniref:Uncharacterized protein n=1 Tax=Aliikangiella coralliicola TaxID=2592383 RepID=A0A545U7F1_9GAMM|nr:DUF6090 family protein [Aliikangiella coralliicola]TQV85400.1 hypothetical protein FLL46_19740 [Aliikangiella coralliicola]